MGGYLSIGLVYENASALSAEFRNLLEYFHHGNIHNMILNYSETESGEVWVEEKVSMEAFDYELLENNFFSILMIEGDLFDMKTEQFVVRVQKEDTYYGFLIDIRWDAVFKGETKKISDHIQKSLIHLLNFTVYKYAFCGHEAEIEVSPGEPEKLGGKYPIIIINDEARLILMGSNYSIDGISSQKSYMRTVASPIAQSG